MDGPRLAIHIKPSVWLLRIVITLHLAACAAVLLCDLGLLARAALLLLVMASLWRELRRHGAAVDGGGLVLKCNDREWSVEEAGKRSSVELLPDTRVLPYAVVVRLRHPDRCWPRSVLLLADSAHADELRRLRTWLRLRGVAASLDPLLRDS